MERRAEDKNDDENRVNEDPKLTKHSANSEYLMENLEMKEGRSPARSDVSNNRDDVLELTPVETRASRGMKHSKESSRFSETGTSRTIGSSLQSDDNDNGDNDKHDNDNDNDNDNGIEMKNLKDSNGEIKGETKVGKEAEIETGKGETAVETAAETAAGETESNGNDMDEELLAKLKSKSKLILPEDDTQSATEAEMEAEKDQEAKKKAEDESEANQKKPKGVGTIDKKALLVIGDEIVAEESNKMNRVDDDTMVDEDKIQEEDKEKSIEKEEKRQEKRKLDPEEVARKAKNLAKLYSEINSEIQNIVNRDKSLFKNNPRVSTNPSKGESGKGGKPMSNPTSSNLRKEERENVLKNTIPVNSSPRSDGQQRRNELENRANALSDSLLRIPMDFNQREEESLAKSNRISKRSRLYFDKSGYRKEPMQPESFQYSVNHVSLYPSFLEIGITSNFDGVSYCSVFDRKGIPAFCCSPINRRSHPPHQRDQPSSICHGGHGQHSSLPRRPAFRRFSPVRSGSSSARQWYFFFVLCR